MKRFIVLLTPYYMAIVNMGFCLVIGIWLLMPFDAFRYEVYDAMQTIAHENIWGGALVFYAGFMAYAAKIKSNKIFAYASFCAAVQFFVSSMLFMVSDWRSILIPSCMFVWMLVGYGYVAGKNNVLFRSDIFDLND